MTGLVGAAAIPAAPLMLPRASPEQPQRMRAQVADLRAGANEVIRRLPDADAVVVVASGPRGIYDRGRASLSPLGVEGADVELPVAEEAIEHLCRLTQYPMFRGDALDIGHSALCLQLAAVRPAVAVVPLSVPGTTDFDVLVSVGASIEEAVLDADLSGVMLCAGDLSAGLNESSPGYAIPGAGDWDAAVVEAVKAGELGALRELGPEEASRVQALGWAPLGVLHGACAAARLRPEFVAYAAPAGVGQLVAQCVPGSGDDGGRRADTPRGRRDEGVVPRTGDPRG